MLGLVWKECYDVLVMPALARHRLWWSLCSVVLAILPKGSVSQARPPGLLSCSPNSVLKVFKVTLSGYLLWAMHSLYMISFKLTAAVQNGYTFFRLQDEGTKARRC